MAFLRLNCILVLTFMIGCGSASESSDEFIYLMKLAERFEGVDIDVYKKDYLLERGNSSYIGALYCSYHKCMDFRMFGETDHVAVPVLSAVVFVYAYLENRSQLAEMSDVKREEYSELLRKVSGCRGEGDKNEEFIYCLKESFRVQVVENSLRVDSVVFDNGVYSYQIYNEDLFEIVEKL